MSKDILPIISLYSQSQYFLPIMVINLVLVGGIIFLSYDIGKQSLDSYCCSVRMGFKEIRELSILTGLETACLGF